MTVYAGVIPAGALHVVTGSAHDIISARGGMDAGQFSDGHQNIYTQQFDNSSDGWPLADIAISLNTSGTAPAGSRLELYMRARSAAGIYGADEPVPADNATDGFIGSRELSGRDVQTIYFRNITIPACRLRFSVRANTTIGSISAKIMPVSMTSKRR